MPPLLTRLFTIILLGSLATGCATATSEPESVTKIESDPAGATCTLENNKGYSKQVVTPATVTLHRDLAPMTIACAAPGHASIREEMKMDGNAMVLGNILLGGIVGIAVDAASGASERFPSQVTILLDPSEFENIAARDAWYEKKKALISKKAIEREMALESHDRSCMVNSKSCVDAREEIQLQTKQELAKLEQVRATATVRQASTIVEIKGKKTCLVQTGDSKWESRPCAAKKKPEPKRARITVDGREQCLVQTNAKTWEVGPCPDKQ